MSDKEKEIKRKWKELNKNNKLSTKEKLEKLVKMNSLKKKKRKETLRHTKRHMIKVEGEDLVFVEREYIYDINDKYGRISLNQWEDIESKTLSIISNDEEFDSIEPLKLLYFDIETTGVSGGTGTIPFMLGFGYFENDYFKVKIFILRDISREEEYLEAINEFIKSLDFQGIVTYNGKAFDFNLMETRYILNRMVFPLSNYPHLDLLYSSRMLWKNTYESRKLGFLGENILGISREEDIPGSLIPSLYNSFLRTNRFELLEKVIEHNALDIVGLNALLLLVSLYMQDSSLIQDEGELFGKARIFERFGKIEDAEKIFEYLKDNSTRDEIIELSIKRLSDIKKKKKLFKEAEELWTELSKRGDKNSIKDLSIHLEHRLKDYEKALELILNKIDDLNLTENQRADMEKRIKRLRTKIKKSNSPLE